MWRLFKLKIWSRIMGLSHTIKYSFGKQLRNCDRYMIYRRLSQVTPWKCHVFAQSQSDAYHDGTVAGTPVGTRLGISDATRTAFWQWVFIMSFMITRAPCRLRRCKNGPATFPGQMSYKATKPGLVLFYILACFNCIVAY